MYITQDEFDSLWFDNIPLQPRKKGNQASSQKYYYKDLVTAFDIETTYLEDIDNSVMYIWQWQMGEDVTIIGRTWYELRLLIEKIEEQLGDIARLVVYVHNLSFEFQFLSGIFDFNKEDVFALDHRKVLKALLHNKIEFRCSYLQTNMSLRSFCEKMGVHSYKLKMDYKKRRYWYTPLTQKEIAYCINDVRGLVQAITKEMERDNDNLYTIPLTSTGYARRDAKRAMHSIGRAYINAQAPDMTIYTLCREAFRGGNTHASRYYSGQILTDLHSADRASAYPHAICNEKFPVSKFFIKKKCSREQLEDLIYKKEKAVLIRCAFVKLRLKDDLVPVPYIPTSKCTGIVNGAFDNGRVLEADYIAQFTMTDLDYRIICNQYDFEMEIITVAYARYGMLPEPLRNCVMEYYRHKTDLKDKPADEEHTAEFYKLLYDKSKNLLNAQFGMMAQDPVKVTIEYINTRDDLFKEDPEADPEELLKSYNKKAFAVYQWGCWVTSWARFRLQEGIDLCGIGFVYCDTDSCKYMGDVDWSILNNPIKKQAIKNKTYAIDPQGKKHYMGVFEQEDDMRRFITLGSKKYAYLDMKDRLHITIAGVNKRIGAQELVRAAKKHDVKYGPPMDPLSFMQPGFKFIYAGGLEARYQDFPDISEYITEDGSPIMITRNVSLVDNTKTLGITAEYKELLEMVQSQNLDR